MEELEAVVETVTAFYRHTLPRARLAGPFSPAALQRMFRQAWTCADLATEDTSGRYSAIVEQLQAQFPPLQAAPQHLLTALADNIRVNK